MIAWRQKLHLSANQRRHAERTLSAAWNLGVDHGMMMHQSQNVLFLARSLSLPNPVLKTPQTVELRNSKLKIELILRQLLNSLFLQKGPMPKMAWLAKMERFANPAQFPNTAILTQIRPMWQIMPCWGMVGSVCKNGEFSTWCKISSFSQFWKQGSLRTW